MRKDALEQIDQQHGSRDKLRDAESIGMEKSTQRFRATKRTECFTMSGTALDNYNYNSYDYNERWIANS